MFNRPNPNRMRALRAFMCVLAFGPIAKAQVRDPNDLNEPRGLTPSGTYRIEDIETINPATGALLLSISLAQLPANRGGDPGFVLKLTYNSSIYNTSLGYGNETQGGSPTATYTLASSAGAGWIYNTGGYSVDFENRPNPNGSTWPCPASNLQLQYFYRMTLILPDGSRHLLRLAGQDVANQTEDGYYQYQPDGVAASHCGNPTQQSPPLTGILSYYTADGTFLNVSIKTATCAQTFDAGGSCPWTLSSPDGSSVIASSLGGGNLTLVSRTGNQTTIQGTSTNSSWITTIADSANRTIVLSQTPGSPDAITVSGVYGDPVQTSVAWKSINISQREYLCAPNGYATGTGIGGENCQYGGPGFTSVVVNSIVLPAQLCDASSPNCGLGYQFGYDTDNNGGGIGEVSSVTTPLGSSIAYHYLMDNNGTIISGSAAYIRNSLSTRTLSPASNETYAFPAEMTTYAITNDVQSTVTAPDGGVTNYYFFSNAPPPYTGSNLPNAGLIYKLTYPDGTIDERYWLSNNPSGFPVGSNTALVFNNPYVNTEYKTIAGQVAIKNYQPDLNGNVTQVQEYDWSSASNIPRTSDSYASPTGVPGGLTPVRTTVSQYNYPATTYPYNTTTSPIFRAAPSSKAVYVGAGTGTASSYAQYSYAAVNSISTSLQMTNQSNWDSIKAPTLQVPLTQSSASVTGYSYDQYGDLLTLTEPNGCADTYSYDSTATLLMQMTRCSGTITTNYTRDPSTGLATNVVPDSANSNNVQTTYDDLGRPIRVQEGYGLSLPRETQILYSVQQRRIITQKDKNQNADGLLITAQHFDSRGRLWRARTLEDGSIASATNSNSAGILTDTEYFESSGARCTVISNPYRSTALSDPTVGWTLTDQDTMGRPIKVWNLPGSSAPSCGNSGSSPSTGFSLTSYNQWTTIPKNGVMTQTTDQSSAVRRSVSDGLGRLVGVVEDPVVSNYQTSYTYDVLDDLTAVTQGAQSRTFGYNSLGRLIASYQPEMNPNGTGSTLASSYTYTNDGLPLTRTDGNGNITHYSYDPLDRITLKAYSGSGITPTVTFCYDGMVTNGDGQCTTPSAAILQSHGRLTETRASEAVSGQSIASLTRYTGFDLLGRVSGSQQTTNGGGPYVFAYTYDLAGALTGEGYPSGRQITTLYDNVERPVNLSGVLVLGATPTPYGSNGSYTAHGSLQSIGLGNTLTETWTYNSRLQATSVGVGNSFSAMFSYPLTANNGNLTGQTINRTIAGTASTLGQSYTYDGVNRLLSATETGGASPEWSQAYGYDQFGNRWVSAGEILSPFTPQASTNFDGANHLKGFQYDSDGQMTVQGAYQFAYDAEGRMQSGSINAATTNYVYDADGRRVMKQAPGGNTVYVYDASGLLTAEYSANPPAELCSTCYVTVDPLGSTRLVTDGSGNSIGCHDFLPFGEEIPAGLGGRAGNCWNALDITQKFTSKERDSETGLDFFGERYFSSAQGRFTSADKPFADQNTSDPQSWNLYSYVRNNPLKLVDVQGGQAAQAIQQQLQQTYDATPPGGIKLAVGVTLAVATIAVVAPDAGQAIGDFVRSLPDSSGSVSTGAAPSLDTMIKGGLSSIFTFPGQAAGVDSSPFQARTNGPSDADFVVSPGGTAVPVGQGRLEQGFKDAGFPSRPNTQTKEGGTVYDIPTQAGTNMPVRVMPGSATNGPRVVMGTNDSPRTADGVRPKPKKEKDESHIEQKP